MDELGGVSERDVLSPDPKTCTNLAVQRDGGMPFEILGPMKEKEKWQNVFSLICGIERKPVWDE